VSGGWEKAYNRNDEVTEDEMGKVCSKNGGEKECVWDIGGKARRKETTRETKKYVGGG
jgi:hypothetical protein